MMNLNGLINDWWGKLEELVEEVEDMGYEVLDQNREYIVCEEKGNDNDAQYIIKLAGTERTIKVDSIEEA